MFKKSSYNWSMYSLVLMALLGVVFSSDAKAGGTIIVDANGSGDFTNIQGAIDVAEEGDIVIIAPGVYNEHINFKNKNIILTSTAPNNPQIVEGTIIQGDGTTSVVTFSGNEGNNCVLSGFTITGGGGDYGGGIVGGEVFVSPRTEAVISNCIVRDNSSGFWGGGIGYFGDDGLIKNCVITGNSSRRGGGLAYCYGTIENCIIANNSASGQGGGLQDCHGPVINCSIVNNTTSGEGGGGCQLEGSITNCTIVGNTASDGGGVYQVEFDGSITNCIIWQNLASANPQIGASNDPSYSCIQGWTSSLGGVGNIGDDPCFVDAGLGDYDLIADSACVDAGDNTAVTVDIDLDGNPRIANGIVDMGAYEFSPAEPADLLDDLALDIIDLELQGLGNSLLAKLDTALQKLADDNDKNDVAAINSLQAFINAVEAQSGKKISQEDADTLIAAAQQIIDILSSE